MPVAKKFEPDSRFAIYDLNEFLSVVSSLDKPELTLNEKREEKAEAQKRMAWVAVASMILFMLLPLVPFIPENRLQTLASLSDMLFLSQASIVGFYFGAQAYMSRK